MQNYRRFYPITNAILGVLLAHRMRRKLGMFDANPAIYAAGIQEHVDNVNATIAGLGATGKILDDLRLAKIDRMITERASCTIVAEIDGVKNIKRTVEYRERVITTYVCKHN